MPWYCLKEPGRQPGAVLPVRKKSNSCFSTSFWILSHHWLHTESDAVIPEQTDEGWRFQVRAQGWDYSLLWLGSCLHLPGLCRASPCTSGQTEKDESITSLLYAGAAPPETSWAQAHLGCTLSLGGLKVSGTPWFSQWLWRVGVHRALERPAIRNDCFCSKTLSEIKSRLLCLLQNHHEAVRFPGEGNLIKMVSVGNCCFHLDRTYPQSNVMH